MGLGAIGMGQDILEYQLRLFRENGALSIVAVTNAMGVSDATYQAEKFLTAQITKIEIWCGGALIKTVRKMDDVKQSGVPGYEELGTALYRMPAFGWIWPFDFALLTPPRGIVTCEPSEVRNADSPTDEALPWRITTHGWKTRTTPQFCSTALNARTINQPSSR